MDGLIREIAVVLTVIVTGISSRSSESLLTEELIDRYGPVSARPVRIQENICFIKMRYIIANVISLDEPNQKMTVSGWLKYSWVDENLQWNLSDTDVQSIRVGLDQIWHPDITLYNNVDFKGNPVRTDLFATVYPDGNVQWSSPAIFVSSCIMDVRYFPFDTQTCELEFGSWSYEGHEVQLGLINGEESSQTEFAENGVWHLHDVITKVQMRKTSGAFDYSTVKMYLILQRRYEFYVSNIMIPCVLLSCMSTLVYLLPPDCGEKISYGMTLVLSLLVFQQLISESLPPVSDGSPILGYYFTFVITMGCFTMVVTSVVLNIYCGKSVRPPPKWAENLFLGKLGQYLGRYQTKYEKKDKLTNSNDHLDLNGMNHGHDTELQSTTKTDLESEKEIISVTDAEDVETEIHDITPDDITPDGRRKWEHISVVVDRLLLISSIGIVVFAAGIMMIMIYSR